MSRKKVVTIESLEAEFKVILDSFVGFPTHQVALCRAQQLGEQLGQAKMLCLHDDEQIEIEISEGNEIAEIKSIGGNHE